ncbi:MAG: hypothetical protein AB7F43_13110 [Bacteriovoracia bacterium]
MFILVILGLLAPMGLKAVVLSDLTGRAYVYFNSNSLAEKVQDGSWDPYYLNPYVDDEAANKQIRSEILERVQKSFNHPNFREISGTEFEKTRDDLFMLMRRYAKAKYSRRFMKKNAQPILDLVETALQFRRICYVRRHDRIVLMPLGKSKINRFLRALFLSTGAKMEFAPLELGKLEAGGLFSLNTITISPETAVITPTPDDVLVHELVHYFHHNRLRIGKPTCYAVVFSIKGRKRTLPGSPRNWLYANNVSAEELDTYWRQMPYDDAPMHLLDSQIKIAFQIQKTIEYVLEYIDNTELKIVVVPKKSGNKYFSTTFEVPYQGRKLSTEINIPYKDTKNEAEKRQLVISHLESLEREAAIKHLVAAQIKKIGKKIMSRRRRSDVSKKINAFVKKEINDTQVIEEFCKNLVRS